MHYYLTLTTKCNLRCKYCYGKTVEDFIPENELKNYDTQLPAKLKIDIEELKAFADQDKDFTITFYGGEPLLEKETIKNIMDKLPNTTFMLQTNGIFLDKFEASYLNKMKTILVSIDGNAAHTNERRGKKVYEKVIKNLQKIRKNGCKAHIIARMTVDETCNIYENVKHLATTTDFTFDGIHWQIDAQFWAGDYENRNFKEWSLKTYNPQISELINWWLITKETKKELPIIYPFTGIMKSLLTKEPTPLRCGAGHSVLGIQTDGAITACPITAGYKPLYMGSIQKSKLEEIKEKPMLPTEPCLKCDIKNICGGRCLYANKSKLWGEKGFDEVCDTVRHLVLELQQKVPHIQTAIEKKVLSVKDFDYETYNGTEIIP